MTIEESSRMESGVKVCESCGYRYEVGCPLCESHRETIHNWRALAGLSSACFWAGDFELATALFKRQLDLEKTLPHCYKCGRPVQYSLGSQDGPFELDFNGNGWVCNAESWSDPDVDCSAPNDIPRPSVSEIVADLEAKGVPVEPVHLPETYDRDTEVAVMDVVLRILSDSTLTAETRRA